MPSFHKFGVAFDGPNIAVYLVWRFEFRKCSTLIFFVSIIGNN